MVKQDTITYQTYSAKPSILGTGAKYGINEMVETGVSMGLMQGRKVVVEGITKDIQNEFVKDMLQDGLSAGLGFFSNQAMQLQEKLLEKGYNSGLAVVATYYNKGLIKRKFQQKFGRGRKATMFAKFLGGNNNRAEESRLIADFVQMDIDSSASSHDTLARQGVLENQFVNETLQVQKEGVSADIARLQIDGMRDTFDMKVKTSSFFVTDKNLIKNMTGMSSVKDKHIKKLNSLSGSMVFEDSEGNYVGYAEAVTILMNGMGLHRA